MEKHTQLFRNTINGGSYTSSNYYKLDLPTGDTKIRSHNTHICRCGRSQNKPLCDESHAQCVNGMLNPWF